MATGDVTGAFLLADMDDFVLVRITGEAVDIMCDVNYDYKAYVTMERGKMVLYMQLVKALYGCVRSAILWYETFCECLEQLGFKLNRYDPCVANKMVNGEQCTICWYVDDCKISHKDPNVVTWVIDNTEKRFGEGSMAFHHIISKLLYVSKRARLDIDLNISFLCTRVSRSTQQDWEKLRRLLVYLRNTIGMVRIIGANSLDVIKIWVDASYGVHHDFRGHTGGTMSMGK